MDKRPKKRWRGEKEKENLEADAQFEDHFLVQKVYKVRLFSYLI